MKPDQSLPATGLGRRELLRIGALSIFGAAGVDAGPRGIARGANASASIPADGWQRQCIFILLQGGASHIDLWDPKPRAVAEIRGPFQPIATNVPGIQFGELLQRSAAVADKLCVIRSMTHRFSNHIAGTYITLTGSTKQPDQDREAHSDDFPGPGAVLNALQVSPPGVPRSVSLPNWLSIPGPSNRMPGQYGGFLGAVHDPFIVEGDPNAAGYKPLALTLAEGMTTDRLGSRLELNRRLDGVARLLEKEQRQQYDRLQQSAYDLVADGRFRRALDLNEESAATRDAYGRTKFGQSLLLARRLMEAGVQFVAYNAFNQEWDTHGGLLGRYKQIVPPMDQAFAALVADLADRGLLERTMVVNTGEFGRTPTINKDAGRDHWPNVYSTVLAGGGVRGGVIFGASDSKGAEPADRPASPADLLATVYDRLGVPPATELRDRLNRPIQLSDGHVLPVC
ncbi:MAG: DUF1501 domain-containing protein [Planctomycetota bacterium]|nr:MAG: DUF1501 domain-containing protein [Planctomycetota bacterium]